MAGGAMDSLPSPITRRNQKTIKSEWFEVQRCQKQVEAEIDVVKVWLTAQNVQNSVGSGAGTQWTTERVTTELSKVLRLGLPVTGESEFDCYPFLIKLPT